MTLTITLPDELMTRLKLRADAERVPVEVLATRALSDLAGDPHDVIEAEFRIRNDRRVALIRKRFSIGLSADEERDLAHLQEQTDRMLERSDLRLLDDVARIESAANRLLQTD